MNDSYLTSSKGQLLSGGSLRKYLEGMIPGGLKSAKEAIRYRPQEKQGKLIEAAGLWGWWEEGKEKRPPAASVIGYGGAAYGGKTYGMLGLGAVLAWAHPGCQIGFFRRTYSEIEGAGGAMHAAHEVFVGCADRRDAGRSWHFHNGSDFYFQHCEHETDVYLYQSKQFDFILLDEATHFSWFQVDYLLTRNRATVSGVRPFAVLSSNPGNIGHAWYMDLFDLENLDRNIKKGLYANVLHVRNANNKWQDTFFIPAFLEDNKIGVERDPEYESRLLERNPDTAQALRYGDWSVFTGQAFREFDVDRHVVKPWELPGKWPRWRAVDWGWDHPFCCLFFCKDPLSGRVYVYRELVQSGLTDEEQAHMIAEQTPYTEPISITWADPAMWASKNVHGTVMSSAQAYIDNGIFVMKADNDRVNGAKKIHNLLADREDNLPGLLIFDNCRHLINILPKLSKAEYNTEDVQKQDGDDPYDCLRYGLSNVGMHGGRRKKENEEPEAPNPWQAISELL